MKSRTTGFTTKALRTLSFTKVFVCASISLWVIIFFSCNKKNQTQTPIFSTSLQTLDHQGFSLKKLADNKASAIIFLQPECPFCNTYGKTLRSLDSTFQSQQVKMYAVVAGTFYPDSEINSYKEKFQLQFPFLLDPDFTLKKILNASVTPQAFLLDKNGNVIYHGMIDNWGYEIGKTRAHATEFYLVDAVNNFLAGKAVTQDSTKAVGCYIQ